MVAHDKMSGLWHGRIFPVIIFSEFIENLWMAKRFGIVLAL
jgi:hypothetical protein